MSDEINIKAESSKTKLLIIIAAIVVAMITIGASIFLTSQDSTAKKLEKQLSLGEKYLSELNYEQAIAAYELAIEIDPKNADAYLGLADVYIAMGEFDKAEDVLDRAKEAVDEDAIRKIEEKLGEVKKEKETEKEGAETDERDSLEPTSAPTSMPTSVPDITPDEPSDSSISAGEVAVGAYVVFGTYEQDNDLSNGAEPIEWQVLDKKDGKVLILSKYALDCKKYHKEYVDITWENCTLRNWINDEFYHTAFSEEEKSVVLETLVKNEDNPEAGTEGGNDTKDRIFLLGSEEVVTYFSQEWDEENPGPRVKITEYAKAQGGFSFSEDEYSWWRLRSAGYYGFCAVIVNHYGIIDYFGYPVNRGDSFVRPALWIDGSAKVSSLQVQEESVTQEVTATFSESEELSSEEEWEITYQKGGFPKDSKWIDDLYQMLITDDYHGVIEVLKDDSIAQMVKPYFYCEYENNSCRYLLVTSSNEILSIQIISDILGDMERSVWYSREDYYHGSSSLVHGDKAVTYYPESNPYRGGEYIWHDGVLGHYPDGSVSIY